MDLIAELKQAASDRSDEDARLMTLAAAEIERCHARLEIDHCFEHRRGEMEARRLEVPYDERLKFPDAVRCRDATIAHLKGEM